MWVSGEEGEWAGTGGVSVAAEWGTGVLSALPPSAGPSGTAAGRLATAAAVAPAGKERERVGEVTK